MSKDFKIKTINYEERLQKINEAIKEILEKNSIEELKKNNNLKELKFIVKEYETLLEDTKNLFEEFLNDKYIDNKLKVELFEEFKKTTENLKKYQELSNILEKKNKQFKENFEKVINTLTKDGFAGLNMAQKALENVTEISGFLDAGIEEITKTANKMREELTEAIHSVFVKLGEITKVQENIGLASPTAKNNFSELVNNMNIEGYKEKINELIEREEKQKHFEVDLNEIDPKTGKSLKEVLEEREKHWTKIGDIQRKKF